VSSAVSSSSSSSSVTKANEAPASTQQTSNDGYQKDRKAFGGRRHSQYKPKHYKSNHYNASKGTQETYNSNNNSTGTRHPYQHYNPSHRFEKGNKQPGYNRNYNRNYNNETGAETQQPVRTPLNYFHDEKGNYFSSIEKMQQASSKRTPTTDGGQSSTKEATTSTPLSCDMASTTTVDHFTPLPPELHAKITGYLSDFEKRALASTCLYFRSFCEEEFWQKQWNKVSHLLHSIVSRLI